MYSKQGNMNPKFYEEYDTDDEEDIESNSNESFDENEIPNYISIADKIPVVDFHKDPNITLDHELNEDDDQISTNNDENENEDTYFPIKDPTSQTSSSKSISYMNNTNNCNTDSTDNISTTAVNDNQSSNSAYDGFSSPCNENAFGIIDIKPELIAVPPFFNDPETIEAMERLGYVQSDLLPSDYTQIPGNEEIRYKIIIELEKRRIQMIEDVLNEREKVIKENSEKESNFKATNFNSKIKHKRKMKKKVKKVRKKKKKKHIHNDDDEDDNSEVEQEERETPRRRRLRKKKQVIEDNNDTLSVTKPAITRKSMTQKELTPKEIRRRRVEEAMKRQQKKVTLEMIKKNEETEKRLKIQQEQKIKDANELKQKRLQRKREIELLKKENELKKQRAAQQALMKVDEVEQRQAQIRKQKLDEIQKKKEIREQRLMRAQAEKKRKQDEQLRELNYTINKAERQSEAIGLTAKTKGKLTRANAKIIVPQVPQRKNQK